jgi:PrtD family type I secretion system ABC transporter
LRSSARFRAGEQPATTTALRDCWGGFIGVGAFSGLMNILMLTGAIFMLQVYDRVLPSRSTPTLLGLSLLALMLFLFLGLLELLRARLLVRIGSYIDAKLSPKAFEATVEVTKYARKSGDGLRTLRDLDQIRAFFATGGPAAVFDLPWLLLYMGICFAFHAWLGLAILAGALILVFLTILAEFAVREPVRRVSNYGEDRAALAAAVQRNSGALCAMGMLPQLLGRWQTANREYLSANCDANDRAGVISGISRTFRMMLQSAVLALGAYLVIQQEATGGIIIASSILAARALAPVELVVGHWKSMVAARQAWGRLRQLLAVAPAASSPLALPSPAGYVAVERLTVVPPGADVPSVIDASFRLDRGDGLGIIGPAASGKSSFARALVGVWPAARGDVRIDGASLSQWDPAVLGRHIGYLPQDIELFAGTVGENIARFDPDAQAVDIIDAACAAGIHELILRLPQGYATNIGDAGTTLSAGQRQRIALARALYRNPFLIVLDEPNSNLDAEGDSALCEALLQARARGAIVVVVAHRPGALEAVDRLLVMKDGRVETLGPKDQILRAILRSPSTIVPMARSA